MIQSIIEIEAEIKAKKITKNLMPGFIRDKVLSALEDSDDSAFRTGKEEGRAEALEEQSTNRWYEVSQEGQTYNELLFAIQVLQDLRSDCVLGLDLKILDLEIQACRQMPINH